MAANAGSMFQYWKRFDLQQLQVSLSLTHFALLSRRFPQTRSGCSVLFAALRRCFFGLASVFFFSGTLRPRHWLKPLSLSLSADQKLILFVRFASIHSHSAAPASCWFGLISTFVFIFRPVRASPSDDIHLTRWQLLSAPDACLWLCYGWIIFFRRNEVRLLPRLRWWRCGDTY